MTKENPSRVLRIEVLSSLEKITPSAWDSLSDPHHPFVEYAFLRLLETSKSVGEGTGWEPAHIAIWEGERLCGAAPAYLKTDSYGEYIFDWEWAGIARRIGVPYFPKIVVGVPYTPATGQRLLVHPSEKDKDRIRRLLVRGLLALMEEAEASSIHILFCTDEEAAFLKEEGFSRRATHQFHWRNNGYTEVEDFLGALRSSCRKQIRKERRCVEQSGLALSLQDGGEVSQADWATLYALYASTIDRKWGSPYLTKRFFLEAPHKLAGRALVGLARQSGEIVAGTLSFRKGQHLYGRYWGCFQHIEHLHFEMCYYQLIEYAIQHGYTLVEAGAQGSHKLKRGFLPVIIHSAHLFRHPLLGEAFAHHAAREEDAMQHHIAASQADGPFRDDALPPFPPLAGIPLGEKP